MKKIYNLAFLLVLPVLTFGQSNNISAPGNFFFSTEYSFGKSTQYIYDTDADGNPNAIEKYTYDANGNRTRYEYDSDADGNPNSIEKYTYDANGNQTRYEYDSDGDGNPNQITKYTYDANGNQTRYENDSDGDGNPNRIDKYTYDANGNQTRYEVDSDGDGNPNSITKYTYDANGNQTREEYDSDGDGNPNRITKTQFFNKVKCATLGDGLAHKLMVTIPEDGVWSFSLCGSSFQNKMALSSASHCDSSIAFVVDGCTSGDAHFHAPLDSGTYYLTILGKGDNDKGDYKLSIEQWLLSTTDLEKEQLVVYPNPATNTLTLKTSKATRASHYEIYSIDGRKVIQVNGTKEEIDISSLDAGVYIIKMFSKGNTAVLNSKFVKTN